MKNKTFWAGFVVALVVTQVWHFLVHGMALSGTYETLVSVFRPEEEMMSMMSVTAAASLFFFCYIFTFGRRRTGMIEGVRFGGLMGLFMTIPLAFDQFVTYSLPLDLALICL